MKQEILLLSSFASCCVDRLIIDLFGINSGLKFVSLQECPWSGAYDLVLITRVFSMLIMHHQTPVLLKAR